ncbi:hypothetical protein IWT25_00777 [Secundilactobacillus pentosiphilus]|uniref:Phage protein n=1 Tax=Secundilactobacillus pentosiphilus TaxID=1714682 RepID=A0A1Z5IVK2_9LACO|nr:hypothetical protein [Secundilactobacillus pentosiphilus]GAX05471.1 hypothetical protein IWT25_00777 [Secundilactobacillus pentosiphilus]
MLDDFNIDEISDRIRSGLPAYFNQEDASINQALLDIIAKRFETLAGVIMKIMDAYELDKADSGTLDMYAADWGVHRIDSDDDYLRMQIRLARMRHRIGTTEDDLIRLISYALQASPSEFHLVVDRNELDGEPKALKIVNIPDKYNEERKRDLLVASLQVAVTPEVRIIEVQFSTSTTAQLYVGAATQIWRKTYPTLITSEGVEADG